MAVPRALSGCHSGGGLGATRIQWVEGRDAAEHPAGHSTAPQPAVTSPNATRAESEGVALLVGNTASEGTSSRSPTALQPRCAQEASGRARGRW